MPILFLEDQVMLKNVFVPVRGVGGHGARATWRGFVCNGNKSVQNV